MKKVAILLLVLTFTAITGMGQSKGNAKDQEAIKSIAQMWQDAWNRHDMTSLSSLVADEVDFVTVSGTWLKNRRDFKEHHAKRHEMQFKESIWTTKNAKVKFIKSDVAVAHVEWGMRGDKDPEGVPRQPREGIFTWVIGKRNGTWLIIAAQNTNVSSPAPAK